MNILPFLSAFILLFTLTIIGAIHNAKGSQLGAYLLEKGYREKEKEACAEQTKLYRKIPGGTLHPTKAQLGHRSRKPYHSPRDKTPPPDEAKLSLSFLFAKEHCPLHEEKMKGLLTYLYQYAPFYYEELVDQVVEELYTLAHSEHPPSTFEEVFEKASEPLQPLFYKLIKGTTEYHLATSHGYPPLGDFFLFKEGGKQALSLRHASRPLLITLFNNSLANRICLEEEEKWKEKGEHLPLTQEELLSLFQKHHIDLKDFAQLL